MTPKQQTFIHLYRLNHHGHNCPAEVQINNNLADYIEWLVYEHILTVDTGAEITD